MHNFNRPTILKINIEQNCHLKIQLRFKHFSYKISHSMTYIVKMRLSLTLIAFARAVCFQEFTLSLHAKINTLDCINKYLY